MQPITDKFTNFAGAMILKQDLIPCLCNTVLDKSCKKTLKSEAHGGSRIWKALSDESEGLG